MTDFSTWFEGLSRTYYTALLAAAERKLSRRELAEEAVQETFLRLWARSERLEKHPNPGGWLMVTLSHVVGHTVRDEAHYVLALPERLPAPPHAPFSLSEVLPAGLSPQERDILLLFYERRRSYREIAQILQISVSNCGARLNRARNRCRALWPGPPG